VTSRFITFEGIDGAGKSTHLGAVAEHLRAAGATVLVTREPGGTPLAEQLRRDHVQQVIMPALQRGETVLSDRFSDASLAYQGGGRGVPEALLQQLEDWVHPGLQPDLTFWFDLPADIAAQRLAGARALDRFEQQDTAFFERVRAAYARRAEWAPARFVRLDAAAPVAEVSSQIRLALEAHGW
jgi:dTMP kinase